jgi:hypothetical protein
LRDLGGRRLALSLEDVVNVQTTIRVPEVFVALGGGVVQFACPRGRPGVAYGFA